MYVTFRLLFEVILSQQNGKYVATSVTYCITNWFVFTYHNDNNHNHKHSCHHRHHHVSTVLEPAALKLWLFFVFPSSFRSSYVLSSLGMVLQS